MMSDMSPRMAIRTAVILIAYRYLGLAVYFLDDDATAWSKLVGILPALSPTECIKQPILISVCGSRLGRIGTHRPSGNRSSRCQNSKTQQAPALEKPVALHSRKAVVPRPRCQRRDLISQMAYTL